MKKLILTTLAISGLLMAVGVVSTISVSANGKALAKEVELRHGADDAPDFDVVENELRHGADDAVDVNDDHRGRGRGSDDLARREDRGQEQEVENEHGVEIENEAETQG